MSEEAQESCNKYIKRYRQDFARKCSTIKNVEDVFGRLLVVSDPFISSLKKLPAKKLKSFSPEVIDLLIPPPEEVASNFYNLSFEENSGSDSNDTSDDC